MGGAQNFLATEKVSDPALVLSGVCEKTAKARSVLAVTELCETMIERLASEAPN